MAYKEELQANNVDLQNILDVINSLPEGGGEPIDPELQSKTVTPTTSQQVIEPDAGYDGLDKVTVNAMPTATQATPSISVNGSGLITASATQSAGYVTAGTKSATKQLTTQAAKTVTPSTSSQTAVASGRYTTGAVTVAAIPSSYVQPSGTKSITENGTHDVKNYANVSVNVAGSGGSGDNVETLTGIVYGMAGIFGGGSTRLITYVGSDKAVHVQEITSGSTNEIFVVKGSYVACASTGYDIASFSSGNNVTFLTYAGEWENLNVAAVPTANNFELYF